MEELATSTNESWAGQFARTLADHRARVQEFLAAQRSRLRNAQADLAEQMERLVKELEQDQPAEAREDLERRSAQLARQTENLTRLQEEIQLRQAEWDQAQQRAVQHLNELAGQVHREQDELARRREELEQHQTRLDASAARLHHDQQSFALEREEHEAQVQHVASLRQTLEKNLAALDSLRAQYEQCQQQTAISAPDRTELTSLREERDRLAQRLNETEQRLPALVAQLSQAEEQLAGLRGAAGDDSADDFRRRYEMSLEDLRELKARNQELEQQLARGGTNAGAGDPAEWESLREERDRLAQQLSETEQRLPPLVAQLSEAEEQLARLRAGGASGSSGDSADDDSADDMRRRYEMSLEDVRELRARVQDLERQLARAKANSAPASGPAPGQRLDWEAEKMRILAALEADFDAENNEEDKKERLRIEEVIRQTDQVLADKDREINELRQLLENQSSNLGAVAVGAAALGEILDKDAIVQEERANLRRLQQEWEEKLRQAEIEISVERAKIARQRAELEGQLHAADPSPSQTQNDQAASAKPAHGRWLSRLGLGGPDGK